MAKTKRKQGVSGNPAKRAVREQKAAQGRNPEIGEMTNGEILGAMGAILGQMEMVIFKCATLDVDKCIDWLSGTLWGLKEFAGGDYDPEENLAELLATQYREDGSVITGWTGREDFLEFMIDELQNRLNGLRVGKEQQLRREGNEREASTNIAQGSR